MVSSQNMTTEIPKFQRVVVSSCDKLPRHPAYIKAIDVTQMRFFIQFSERLCVLEQVALALVKPSEVKDRLATLQIPHDYFANIQNADS